MRSGITRRWLRGNLLITVLLVLLAETMFLYNYTRSYYNSVRPRFQPLGGAAANFCDVSRETMRNAAGMFHVKHCLEEAV